MVATRFAVAAHILLLLAGAERGRGMRGFHRQPTTSARLAAAVNTNPVVIRRITGQLARAGLISVRRGPGGAELARPPEAISLSDVWEAVHAGRPRALVPLHASPAESEQGAHAVLAAAFSRAEDAFRAALAGISLAQLADGLAPREWPKLSA